MRKSCNTCSIVKDELEYHKDTRSSDGRLNRCKLCRNSLEKEKRQSYYKENKQKILKQREDYYKENRDSEIERKREFRKNNKEKVSISKRKYYNKNRDYIIKKSYEWASSNKGKVASIASSRRLRKKNATIVKDPRVDKIFEKCSELSLELGVQFTVDHIIPLTHPDVCGLHVWDNLQILDKSLNSSKYNKFDGTYENSSWGDL